MVVVVVVVVVVVQVKVGIARSPWNGTSGAGANDYLASPCFVLKALIILIH